MIGDPFLNLAGGTLSGPLSFETLVIAARGKTADAAPADSVIGGQSAYPQATVNTTGGDLILAAGIGRRLFTAVSNVAGAVTLTITVDGGSVSLASGVDFTLGTDDTAPQLAVTATNLAAAINADATLSVAVSAAASAANVYLTRLPGNGQVVISTDEAGRVSVTQGTDGAVQLISPLSFPTGSNTQATANCPVMAWGAGTASQGYPFIFTALANANKDHDHAAGSNPTLFIHSATDPDTANTQWISLSHNQTDGVISVGTGALRVAHAATQTFGAFSDNLQILSSSWFGWTPSTIGAVSDTGLARPAARIIRVTDGTTGYGSLRAEWPRRTFSVHKTPGTAATLTANGGAPTHTLTGTASNVSDSTGHYVQLSGDAAIAGVDIATTEVVKTEIGPIATFVIKTGAALPTDATERIWVGLSSASLAAADSPTGAHVAAFRYAIDSDGTLFWRTVTNDGGADTGTVTITTAAIAAATRYVLTIDSTDPASITFHVNGALVATHAANLPTVTQALGTQCFALDAGAGTMELLISKITYETN